MIKSLHFYKQMLLTCASLLANSSLARYTIVGFCAMGAYCSFWRVVMFDGFPREMNAFFAALAFNNNRTFFEENKHIYERAIRQPMIALCEALAPVVLAVDPLLDARPLRCVSRIHRDVRFSKDKSPYRDYMWFCFKRAGETREDACGFYFDISATAVNWGVGYYHAQNDTMQNIRDAIIKRPGLVLEVIEDAVFRASFALMGERYARKYLPPEGLPVSLSQLYQMKNVYAEHHLEDMELLFTKDLIPQIAEGFRASAMFYTFLRDCMVRRD